MAKRVSIADVVRQVSRSGVTGIQRSDSDKTEKRYLGRSLSMKWAKSSQIISRINKLVQSGNNHVAQIVRLECPFPDRSRFLVVVCNETVKEYCLLGVDCTDVIPDLNQNTDNNPEGDQNSSSEEATETIGLVMSLSLDTVPRFDGDGGFKLKYAGRNFLFKPVSLQALWKIIQTLHMISDRLTPKERIGFATQVSLDLISEGDAKEVSNHSWVNEYKGQINSPQSCVNLWERFEDIMSQRPATPYITRKSLSNVLQDEEDIQSAIKSKLRSIMRHVDLDRITSRVIRKELETEMNQNLDKHKAFIDEEILLVLGQMDPASKILEYMYLVFARMRREKGRVVIFFNFVSLNNRIINDIHRYQPYLL